MICDYREAKIIEILKEKDILIKTENLKIGDFLISDEIIIERKRAEDFAKSIIDGRIFSQYEDLKQYKIPIIIIEGDLHSIKTNIHPNSLRGVILRLIMEGINIIFSKNEEETVEYLILLEKKYEKDGVLRKYKYGKKPIKDKEYYKRYILESFPGIGPTLAERLLEKFKTLKNIFNASSNELIEVKGMNKKIIKNLKDILER